MQIRLDGWAWAPRTEFTAEQIDSLRSHLTVTLRGDDDAPAKVIQLYRELPDWFGVPREYYLPKRKPHHVIEDHTTAGNMAGWPGKLTFNPARTLKPEQAEALDMTKRYFALGPRGGLVRAAPGWGKTVYACSVIAEENAPTLVVVHKEFLKNQWRERLEEYLPGVKIGAVQGDTCDYEGKHVVLGMVQSLSSRRYDREFYKHFGLIVSDEVHRIGAYEWSPVPGMFPARHCLGITATPRRKDGAENVFRYHIGQEIFAAKQESLPFKARFLYSEFYLVKTTSYNGTAGRAVTINYLTQNETRNRLIAHDMAKALAAGRKLLVVSERLEHLKLLDAALRETLATASAPVPSIGYFVGGKSEEQLDKAAGCQVIFATTQLVLEGLDIPALDTLFLTTPLADVEQAIGRIRRPCEGKKAPVVVDVRDDRVPMCRSSATSRLSYYQRMNALDNRA